MVTYFSYICNLHQNITILFNVVSFGVHFSVLGSSLVLLFVWVRWFLFNLRALMLWIFPIEFFSYSFWTNKYENLVVPNEFFNKENSEWYESHIFLNSLKIIQLFSFFYFVHHATILSIRWILLEWCVYNFF